MDDKRLVLPEGNKFKRPPQRMARIPADAMEETDLPTASEIEEERLKKKKTKKKINKTTRFHLL
jgi:hypothetical protein